MAMGRPVAAKVENRSMQHFCHVQSIIHPCWEDVPPIVSRKIWKRYWLVVWTPPKILVSWDDYSQYTGKTCSKPPPRIHKVSSQAPQPHQPQPGYLVIQPLQLGPSLSQAPATQPTWHRKPMVGFVGFVAQGGGKSSCLMGKSTINGHFQ